MSKPKVIVICGPTASGKTALSIELAKKIKAAGKSAFVTMNANCYSTAQIDYVRKNYFPAMKEAELDGLIVSVINCAHGTCHRANSFFVSSFCKVYI